MDRSEALNAIAAEAARGEIVFPTSAKLALKAKQTLDNPRCHIDSASRLVQAEPLLAARTVALANSLAYNPGGPEVTDVRSAIARIGFGTVRVLAAALVTRQMAGILDRPEHHVIAMRLWEHSANVAALARVIARRISHQDPETAMFAGIVHEAGSFYLLSRLGDFPELLPLPPSDAGNSGENAIARAVLKALDVPACVLEAMEHYWQGRLSVPPESLGDTLLLAKDLAPVQSPMQPLRATDSADPSSGQMAGEAMLALVQESSEEFESLTAALRF